MVDAFYNGLNGCLEFGEIDVGNYPGPGAVDPDYGKPTAYQAPRSVRFSVAYRF